MDRKRRKTNERSDQVAVTGPKDVDDVLPHQVPVLGSESLEHRNETSHNPYHIHYRLPYCS